MTTTYQKGDRLVALKDINNWMGLHPDEHRHIKKGEIVVFSRYNMCDRELFYWENSCHGKDMTMGYAKDFALYEERKRQEGQQGQKEQKKNDIVCKCDLWKGCTCGAMQLEERIS